MDFLTMYDFAEWLNGHYGADYSQKEVAQLAYELTVEWEYCDKMDKVTPSFRKLLKQLFATKGDDASKWARILAMSLANWSDDDGR